MKYVDDEFRIKKVEADYKITMIYDRWGGMRILKESTDYKGTNSFQEVYLPRDAMFDIAKKLVTNKCCTNAS